MTPKAQRADSIDEVIAQWLVADPSLDPGPISVMTRILAIARRYHAALTRVATRNGMIVQDLMILLALRRANRPLTPTELFQEMAVTSGAMTKRIDQLEGLGMVSRRPASGDGRSTEIHLERRARRIVDEQVSANREPEFEVIARFDATRREQLIGLLRDLLAALEDAETP